VLAELEVRHVDGVLLDLGLSSDQLADDARGFSFNSEGELDLRFDITTGEPAWRLIARLGSDELADLIYRYGEERLSRRIARKLVERRETGPLQRADEIAEVIRRAMPRARPGSIDPATRTFQALRIAVNDELGALERTLAFLPDVLRPGGRAAIISFHSLEDRLVKQAFRDNPRWKPLTSKPVVASESEVHQNPRARSAKLRAAERVAT
jgi:16S rRNA (cytosine1402-N4)-methyltransferase